jgi:hypothetical protein
MMGCKNFVHQEIGKMGMCCRFAVGIGKKGVLL